MSGRLYLRVQISANHRVIMKDAKMLYQLLILYSLYFLVLTIEIHLDEKWLDEQNILLHMKFCKLNYLNKSTSE